MQIIVVGIGTEVGKTIVSAVLVERLQADYWKPVQSGCEAQTDTARVQELVTYLPERTFHPETYCLKAPLSPHAAAELEGISLEEEKIVLPATTRPLVVELAGGLLVPITYYFLNVHLVQRLNLPVVLVASYYLGSINHTLLTYEVLQKYGVPILGIIFNGETVRASKEAIMRYTCLPVLGEIAQHAHLTQDIIREEARNLQLS
jgi:dethiobiotin synthetase